MAISGSTPYLLVTWPEWIGNSGILVVSLIALIPLCTHKTYKNPKNILWDVRTIEEDNKQTIKRI